MVYVEWVWPLLMYYDHFTLSLPLSPAILKASVPRLIQDYSTEKPMTSQSNTVSSASIHYVNMASLLTLLLTMF